MTRQNRKSYHHGNLRDRVIEGALEALKTQSIEALSLRKIAKEIGVSHNAPYMHFMDKEALWEAITAQGFNLLADSIRAAIPGATDVRERLACGCVAYVKFASTNREHYLVMFRPRPLDLDRRPTQEGTLALSLLSGELAAGMQAGIIRQGDAEEFAATLWAALHGAAMIKTQALSTNPVFRDANGTTKLIDNLLLGFETQ